MDVGILLVDRNSGKLWQKRTPHTVATGWVDVAAGGGGASVPTGTGFVHVTTGAQDAAARTVSESDITTTDITTGNASTTKHGFSPKLPNDVTLFYNGTGGFTVPAGGSGGAATNLSPWTTDINGNNKSLTNAANIIIGGTNVAEQISVLTTSDALKFSKLGDSAANAYLTNYLDRAIRTLTTTTPTLDLSLEGQQYLTLSGDTTVTLANAPSGAKQRTVFLNVLGNATRTIAFAGTTVNWLSDKHSPPPATWIKYRFEWNGTEVQGAVEAPLLGWELPLAAGTNTVFTTNGNNLVINSTGSGGGSAPVGTMVQSGITTQYRVPKAADTTGTNFIGSGMIGDSTGTNMNVLGTFTADNIRTTNGIIPLSIGNSKIVRTDSTGKLTPVTIGSGITFDGTTLSSSATATATNIPSVIGFTTDGGGSTVTTGAKAYIIARTGGTITGWNITAVGSSPTCTIDVWKIATGTALPTVSNTIMGTKPALSTGNAIRSSTLTGWTNTYSAGDIFGFNVDAVTVATKLTFQLETTQ